MNVFENQVLLRAVLIAAADELNAGCKVPAVLLQLLPYLLKSNPVNPV